MYSMSELIFLEFLLLFTFLTYYVLSMDEIFEHKFQTLGHMC